MSPEWFKASSTLAHMASVAEMERRLPDKGASVWEGEEQALRIILESGKTNLILRFVDEYLQGCQAFLSVESSLTKYQLAGCRKFEYGAGALLADLWQHTEAVVSSDLQMGAASLKAICELVQSRPPIHKLLAEAPSPSREEIPEVAPAVRDGGAAASGGSGAPSEPSPAVVASRYIEAAERLPPLGLEAFVLRMLLGYSKAAVGPAERRIVGEFMHRGVLEAGFVHLQVFGELLPEEEVAAGAEGLAKLIATEEFGSNKAKTLASADASVALCALKTGLLERLSKDLPTRRKLRPLLDLAAEAARKAPGKR